MTSSDGAEHHPPVRQAGIYKRQYSRIYSNYVLLIFFLVRHLLLDLDLFCFGPWRLTWGELRREKGRLEAQAIHEKETRERDEGDTLKIRINRSLGVGRGRGLKVIGPTIERIIGQLLQYCIWYKTRAQTHTHTDRQTSRYTHTLDWHHHMSSISTEFTRKYS